jgi:arginine N-succinyltransferase
MTPASTLVVRPARADDLDALYALALQTGGGFTNLPPDRAALDKRLQKSLASFADPVQSPRDQMYLLMMEDTQTGKVIGTANLFSRLGTEWPFYSFRISRVTQTSMLMNKTLTSEVLNLVNDFDGATEVGGLFLDPAWRKGGAGRLIARSRYLLIAQMRACFPDRVAADLRGYQAEDGSWPFWDGLGRHFFDMPFEEADKYNAVQGNQFIADLMPKYPIYVRLLPEAARAAIGRPNKDGEPAMRLLQQEGFRLDGYVDIFDAGPTAYADINSLKAVRDSQVSTVSGFVEAPDSKPELLCAGSGNAFRATLGAVVHDDGQLKILESTATALNVGMGDEVRHVSF